MKKNSATKLALGWGKKMKYGPRTLGAASLEVLQPLALPKKMHKDVREIVKVHCDPLSRGSGEATALMESVCAEADAKRMVLVLCVDPYGDDAPLTKGQLLRWYCNKFDFNPIQEEPLMLARMWDPFAKPALAKKVSQIITEGFK